MPRLQTLALVAGLAAGIAWAGDARANGAPAPCTVGVTVEPPSGSTSVAAWTLSGVFSWEVASADAQVRDAVRIFDLDGNPIDVLFEADTVSGLADGWYRIALPANYSTPMTLEDGTVAQVDRFGIFAGPERLMREGSGWFETQLHFGPAPPELASFRQCLTRAIDHPNLVTVRFSEPMAWADAIPASIVLRDAKDELIACEDHMIFDEPHAYGLSCEAGREVSSVEVRGATAAVGGAPLAFPAAGDRLPLALGDFACFGWQARPYDRAFEARHGRSPDPMPDSDVPACNDLGQTSRGCTAGVGPSGLALLFVLGLVIRRRRR